MHNRFARYDVLIVLIAITVGILCAIFGVGQGIDVTLRQSRDTTHRHAASGSVAIIEIDSKSLEAIAHWPWPRRVHAQLVDRLRQDGIRIAAFDVDLSTPSFLADDQLLAKALQRSEGAIVLPTFRQQRSNAGSEVFENLPLPAFREHAFLGGVNIFTDPDGLVRRYESGVITDNIMRPSVAALLAEASRPNAENFMIDLSIDPNTIPRYSYVDVLKGKINAAQLRNKRIIIGATAIEMGDRYVMPGAGVLPGVVIQALAVETLLQGGINADLGTWPILSVTIAMLLLLLRFKARFSRILILVIGLAGTMLMPLILEIFKIASVQVAPSLIALSLSGILLSARHIQRKFDDYRTTDTETGLQNRFALTAHLRKNTGMSVIIARIQNFSEINSVVAGPQMAELLLLIVERIKLGLGTDCIFRIEENALACLGPDADHQIWADQFDGLAAIFRSAIAIGGRAIEVNLTFGVNEGQGNSDAKLRVALALLAADRAAHQGIRWDCHNAQHSIDLDWKLSLLGDFDSSLAKRELWIAYQPKLALNTNEIIGAEALVRWSHPVLGQIAPDHFIPMIEHAGQIDVLTLFVLKEALVQIENWQNDKRHLSLAVNISALLLGNAKFIGEVVALVNASAIIRDKLTLEITESAALSDPDTAIQAMRQLRELGLRISIDDYGTGQSTLSYLKRLPASEIKIDKCFITNIVHDTHDQILVRSTISLAHELGFQVVAEGIENAACLALLGSLGCDIGQGWIIGKPVAIDVFNVLHAKTIARAA